MLQLVRKSRFKKDFKKLLSSGEDLDKLASVIRTLQAQKALPERNRDHALIGNYIGHRECHISPDWLLIYQTTQTELILVRTGSHSELFNWFSLAAFYASGGKKKPCYERREQPNLQALPK